MRREYLRNILIALCLCLISCGNSSATSKDKSDVKMEEISKIIKETSDSLEVKMSAKIESLNSDILKKINELQKELYTKSNFGNNKWLIYSWLLLITGVIIWLVYCWNKTPEKKDYRRLEDEILYLENKLNSLLKKQEQEITKNKNTIVRDNDAVQIQMQDLLQRMFKLEKHTNEIVESRAHEHSRVDPPKKEGYFGMVKGKGIFNDEYISKQDKCRFKVYYSNNGNEAEFDLIDLNRIRSLDGIEKAIEFDTSEVSLEEASHYDLLKKGLAVKDGDFWEIKQKVSVRLKK